uniref:Uncharacterized protein n=1 Tax=Cannabis sativa TaxID=3483 RepID=A0A803QGI8_CANSA
MDLNQDFHFCAVEIIEDAPADLAEEMLMEGTQAEGLCGIGCPPRENLHPRAWGDSALGAGPIFPTECIFNTSESQMLKSLSNKFAATLAKEIALLAKESAAAPGSSAPTGVEKTLVSVREASKEPVALGEQDFGNLY